MITALELARSDQGLLMLYTAGIGEREVLSSAFDSEGFPRLSQVIIRSIDLIKMCPLRFCAFVLIGSAKLFSSLCSALSGTFPFSIILCVKLKVNVFEALRLLKRKTSLGSVTAHEDTHTSKNASSKMKNLLSFDKCFELDIDEQLEHFGDDMRSSINLFSDDTQTDGLQSISCSSVLDREWCDECMQDLDMSTSDLGFPVGPSMDSNDLFIASSPPFLTDKQEGFSGAHLPVYPSQPNTVSPSRLRKSIVALDQHRVLKRKILSEFPNAYLKRMLKGRRHKSMIRELKRSPLEWLRDIGGHPFHHLTTGVSDSFDRSQYPQVGASEHSLSLSFLNVETGRHASYSDAGRSSSLSLPWTDRTYNTLRLTPQSRSRSPSGSDHFRTDSARYLSFAVKPSTDELNKDGLSHLEYLTRTSSPESSVAHLATRVLLLSKAPAQENQLEELQVGCTRHEASTFFARLLKLASEGVVTLRSCAFDIVVSYV